MALGPYRGTVGVFQGLRDDTNWAVILEPNGNERFHPLKWMERIGAPEAATKLRDPATVEAIQSWEGEGGSPVSRPLVRRAG